MRPHFSEDHRVAIPGQARRTRFSRSIGRDFGLVVLYVGASGSRCCRAGFRKESGQRSAEYLGCVALIPQPVAGGSGNGVDYEGMVVYRGAGGFRASVSQKEVSA
jgi:hypothetical protein